MKHIIDSNTISRYCKYLDLFNAPKEQICYLPIEVLKQISENILCKTPTGGIVHNFERDAKIKEVPAYQFTLNAYGYCFHFIASEQPFI